MAAQGKDRLTGGGRERERERERESEREREKGYGLVMPLSKKKVMFYQLLMYLRVSSESLVQHPGRQRAPGEEIKST